MWEKGERGRQREGEQGEEADFCSPAGPCLCALAVLTAVPSEGSAEKCASPLKKKSHQIHGNKFSVEVF